MEDQKTVACPLCFTTVKWGARVCLGCQANIEYGAPTSRYWLALAASAFLGISLRQYFSGWFLIIPFLIAFTAFAYLCYLIGEINNERANFRRYG